MAALIIHACMRRATANIEDCGQGVELWHVNCDSWKKFDGVAYAIQTHDDAPRFVSVSIRVDHLNLEMEN